MEKEFMSRRIIAFIPFLRVRIPREDTLERSRVQLVTTMLMKMYIDRAPEKPLEIKWMKRE